MLIVFHAQKFPFHVILCMICISIIQAVFLSVPWITDVTLYSLDTTNTTIAHNRSVDECLCLAYPNFIALNWFPNHTCQLFYDYPLSYTLQSIVGARLYFVRGIFPNDSQCADSYFDTLLENINNASNISTNVTIPRNLIVDDHGYIVTVDITPSTLNRYLLQTLSLIDRTSFQLSSPMVIGYTNNTYFVGFVHGPIVAVDGHNLSILGNTTSPLLKNVRGITFLDQGRTMVVSAFGNKSIVFFNLTDSIMFVYSYMYHLTVTYSVVHGLTSVNDSFFYATSYSAKSIYSYSRVGNSSQWNETLVVNAQSWATGSGGAFVFVDVCSRLWLFMEGPTVYVFTNRGSLLGNISFVASQITAGYFLQNSALYLSDREVGTSKIFRIDLD